MELDESLLPKRERLILAGLYLAKYDSAGLKRLGFASFLEAFNAIGYAMGARPASIKNYRDEFDPLFPNPRKGWRKRPPRKYCMKVLEDYAHVDLESFAILIESFVGYDGDQAQQDEPGDETETCFAKRLITGLAAEHYFETIQPKVPEFKDYKVQNTTRLGCGFDYRLTIDGQDEFLAVEVKGLSERTGSVSLTPKEHRAAAALGKRFFLFVVKKFQELPFHQIFPNPLSGVLEFTQVKRVTVQISWLANV